jgi:hypothetical protein
MQETDMAALNSGSLRWREAEYFLEQYIKHCGPPVDSYFHMVCYLDAFLFAFISIEEVVSDSIRGNIRRNDSFLFLKALRNTNAHHIILGIGLEDSKFHSPISRVLSLSVGGEPNNSSKLKFRFDDLRQIFANIEIERLGERRTLEGARRFMTVMEAQNRDTDFLESFMREGLNEVQAFL